jgi:hypothetical protein
MSYRWTIPQEEIRASLDFPKSVPGVNSRRGWREGDDLGGN